MTRLALAAGLALAFAAPAARAQAPDTVFGLRSLGLKRDTVRAPVAPPFVSAGVVPLPLPATVGAQWQRTLERNLAARRAARWRAILLGTDTGAVAALPAARLLLPSELPPASGPSVLSQYAQLGLLVNASFEMRFDQIRNLHCTAADAQSFDSGCRGGFTPPQIDPQFTVRSGGVVGQRVHLNIDYDTQREFDASNNIQVSYQGLEDEIIRRVQVGNVSFAAPNSRFITGGIPANNFGAEFEGQLGALDFSAIFAQQKGNVVQGRTFTVGSSTVQPQDREVDDRDYEPLRFFFVVDPASLPNYPAVDVLNLSGTGLPAADQVQQVRIYRRLATAGTGTTQLGGIQAVAVRSDSPQRAGPFAWQLLTLGRDYYLDPSGTWFALANRLDENDYLAVSYVTAGGDTVGTFPGTARAGVTDTLELIHDPLRGPEVPTYRYEMRNVYPVGAASAVVRASAQLSILVSESEKPTGSTGTFLSLLGMAQATNPSVFDQYNRMFPRAQDPGGGSPLTDYYVIFPNLAPFADSTKLSAQFRNDSLYRTPDYLLRTQGPSPLFQLRLHYDATGSGDRSVLSLGAVQMRAGSERIVVNGRQLTRGTDYTMNYDVGQVTFLNPDSLFPQPTTVTVQYEENPAFAVAPTSIYGLQSTYDLGDHGSFGMVGLLQQQRTTYTRPPLGFEPQSNMIGGITANLRFEPNGITRMLDALPMLRTSTPSSLTLNGEIATSRPSPNQLGTAYVETFEDEGGTFLPLAENSWQFGSRPASADGLDGTGISAAGFSDDDAALLVWQNLWQNNGQIGQFQSSDIDPAIKLEGVGNQYETVLWLTLQPDTIGGLWNPDTAGVQGPRWYLPHTPGPRWRSISTSLSSTGVDLSRTEYLEFWVYEDSARTARTQGVTIAFDFGTVYEDAVAFEPTGFHVNGRDTTYVGRRRAGEGRLDTERDTLTGAWSAGLNDIGILGDVADTIRNLDADTLVHDMPLCESQLSRGLVIYPIGVDLPRCTRHNGHPDTEDLNNDEHLDSLISSTEESYYRYVFHMNDDRYFVRDGGAAPGGAMWRLYRIPFTTDGVQVGQPDIRLIRALRMTVMAPDNGTPEKPIYIGLARVQLVGAPWLKTSDTPIAGISGSTGQAHGAVIASVVSTEDAADLGYVSPPGVTDAGNTTTGAFQAGAVQINERSLRLIGTDIRPGERAESYEVFPDGQKNFLGYRQLRVWARGRPGQAGWDSHQLAFFVKVGQDQNNFYYYRQYVSSASWQPEVVVDFERWLALRAEIEQSYLHGDKPSGAAACGGDTLAYVRCDGPYLVQVRDPGVAPPNLTKVQELAVGFVRDSGTSTDSTELWVDDIRLSSVVKTPGYAGALDAHLTAADVADFNLSMSRRDPNFRQLGESPSYQTDNQLAIGGTVRLERFGLERLGIALPVTVQTTRSSSDPFYLSGTDIEAAGIDGLRTPLTSTSAYSFTLRRTRRGSAWWQRALVDDINLAGSWNSGLARTSLSNDASHASDLQASYQVQPGALSVSYMPGPLRDLLDHLPGFLRNTALVRGLRHGRLRLTPTVIGLGTELASATSQDATFSEPISMPGDTANLPVHLSSTALRDRANLELLPFSALSIGASLNSDRDLRDYGDSTTVGRLTEAGRRSFLGSNIGFERDRQVSTRLSYSPDLVSWIRPRFATGSTFSLTRDPNQALPERSVGDTAGAFRLPTTFSSGRTSDITGSVDFSTPLRAVFGDSSLIRRALDRVSQFDFGHHSEHRSQYSGPGFDPGLGFQAGLSNWGSTKSLNNVLATSATDVSQNRFATSLQMPLGVAGSAAYTSTSSETWLRRGDLQQPVIAHEEDWPNVSARWLWTPRTGLVSKAIASVSASVGARRTLSSTVQPTLGENVVGSEVSTSTESRSAPLTVSVLWANKVSSSYQTTDSRSHSVQAGTVTNNDQIQHSVDASFSLHVPPEIIPLHNDVRTSLRYTSSRSLVCVQTPQTPSCLSVSDSRRSEYTLLMNTDMPPNISAGLSASYVLTEDVTTNRKFSQLTLTATVRVVFQAGEAQ